MVSAPSQPNALHSLDLVIDFVNTLDVEEGTDSIGGPPALAAWLKARRLLAPGARALSETDHAHATRLGEAVRALMPANTGQPAEDQAGRERERAARRGELAVHFEPGP